MNNRGVALTPEISYICADFHRSTDHSNPQANLGHLVVVS